MNNCESIGAASTSAFVCPLDSEIVIASRIIRNLSIEAFTQDFIKRRLISLNRKVPTPKIMMTMINMLKYILNVHQNEYVSESTLRKRFENNPDVSKGVRFLVSSRVMIRKGSGGRMDPFMYIVPVDALVTV